ncbi:hypothetical protein [Periweissella fabalis]|uniref:Uncharacterized protein n=1 Tax=Periweissella fabalis TaxID=1070421 RepID=A0A7X6N253_9LACO|nr:hypothetical protein [Periweissella fabalis]MCM0599421.1 hypothetical protein [Periweissella fabalis]NKZ23700.1 hypothetical protein [Periweissella fabalis]
MKIIAIILFTMATIALVVFIMSTINIIRWRNIKEMQHASRLSLAISFLILLVSSIGGYWSIKSTSSKAVPIVPAIQKKDSALPGASQRTSIITNKSTNKPKGTMVNTFSNAKQYPYSQLVTSDKLASKAFALNQAQIVQVGNSNGHPFALVFDTSAPKDFYIIVFKDQETIKVGSKISITGVIGKRTNYQTNDKQTKTVPTIYVIQSVVTN